MVACVQSTHFVRCIRTLQPAHTHWCPLCPCTGGRGVQPPAGLAAAQCGAKGGRRSTLAVCAHCGLRTCCCDALGYRIPVGSIAVYKFLRRRATRERAPRREAHRSLARSYTPPHAHTITHTHARTQTHSNRLRVTRKCPWRCAQMSSTQRACSAWAASTTPTGAWPVTSSPPTAQCQRGAAELPVALASCTLPAPRGDTHTTHTHH